MALRLGKTPKGLQTVELPGGVVCQCIPPNTIIWEAARSYALRTLAAIQHGNELMEEMGIDLSMLPDMTSEDAREGVRHYLFVMGLARTAIKSWTGVDQEIDGVWVPAPVTRAAISELMLLHNVAERFLTQYGRNMLEAFAEGNGSRLSPNGTSAEGLNTAKAARSPARPARKAAKGKRAKGARISKTRRRPTPELQSGG